MPQRSPARSGEIRGSPGLGSRRRVVQQVVVEGRLIDQISAREFAPGNADRL